MHYIIFDLEFNQDIPSIREPFNSDWLPKMPDTDNREIPEFPYEIIQIGALKLDEEYRTIGTFNSFIKPFLYSAVNPVITELTGITTEKLKQGEPFPKAYKSFLKFMNDSQSILCVWGMSDLKVLYKNAEYHKLDVKSIPRMYINIQPFVPQYLNLADKKLLRLKTAAELLNIPLTHEFHNALYDSYYTAEIFKKLNNSTITPKIYDPAFVTIRPKRPKRTINFPGLIAQIEKMYDRSMTEEEQEIIKLAYKMGRTNQFVD
ncbi:DNA polymerase III [Anaerocolumna sedimenticola]|uniref:DNA polymerase III n=1 Tax=Anaerocolumna sedimenticola TaxID=2696063 RepID=A0A6P1TJX5_9FIRM|nr:3'-5' exonuclease [Anaerocolumna sedimenticola]QHQ60361.1 DNA polymerase III [Anaerocolumna sedimenticola]